MRTKATWVALNFWSYVHREILEIRKNGYPTTNSLMRSMILSVRNIRVKKAKLIPIATPWNQGVIYVRNILQIFCTPKNLDNKTIVFNNVLL